MTPTEKYTYKTLFLRDKEVYKYLPGKYYKGKFDKTASCGS